MDAILNILAIPLSLIMRFSYNITNNYGWAILLFTVITRIIILPVSIWMHRYSIRLVKMTPDLLGIKVAYFGDNDRIAEEQSKLYKERKYNPFVTFIPLLIQLTLLMGFIQVINHPMEYILMFDEKVISTLCTLTSELTGLSMESSALQISAVNLIQHNTHADAFAALSSALDPQVLTSALESIRGLNTTFLGIDLTLIPSMVGGWTIVAPLAAGLAAYCLCVVQNRANVLQSEQGAANRWSTMALSVGLSMYLGYFVPLGVALYWIMGNFVAIVQQYFMNAIIPPRKHIDYEKLEENKKKLEELNAAKATQKKDKELARRERADIKRFNSVANKHLVFYSESSGFYKYYKDIIEELLRRSNVTIHYITSDPNDAIFKLAENEKRIRAYYVGQYKLIPLMMRLECDICVMTTPDLDNYQLKRSYMKKDIEYIYIQHGMGSNNLALRKGSCDHFDTVYCCGPHQYREYRQTEALYGLPAKTLVEWGYSLLDNMRKEYNAQEHKPNPIPEILIAPSWQDDNIIDLCIDELLEQLTKLDVHITVRPHPQHVRLAGPRIEAVRNRWQSEKVEIQTDFTRNDSVFNADLMLTDWSGITWEYVFTTYQPVLYIDTPMKVMNPEYDRIEEIPANIALRDKTGRRLALNELDKVAETVREMLENKNAFREKIAKVAEDFIYNPGTSAQVGASYILNSLKAKQKKETK